MCGINFSWKNAANCNHLIMYQSIGNRTTLILDALFCWHKRSLVLKQTRKPDESATGVSLLQCWLMIWSGNYFYLPLVLHFGKPSTYSVFNNLRKIVAQVFSRVLISQWMTIKQIRIEWAENEIINAISIMEFHVFFGFQF